MSEHTNRSARVEDFLLGKGFVQVDCHMPTDSDCTVANYFRVPYERKDLPDCLCNDKPPQIHVAESHLELNGHVMHSFSVQITNEAPQGWIEFKYHGLSEDDILTRFHEIVEALFSAWKALFITGETK